jgi:hypothetical protein
MTLAILGKWKCKAPAMNRKALNPFEHTIGDVASGERLAKEFGYTYNPGSRFLSSACWIYLKWGVPPHSDYGGLCMIYLHRGGGYLCVHEKGKLKDLYVEAREVVLFNDRQTHLWIPDSACTMLVVNVRGKPNDR